MSGVTGPTRAAPEAEGPPVWTNGKWRPAGPPRCCWGRGGSEEALPGRRAPCLLLGLGPPRSVSEVPGTGLGEGERGSPWAFNFSSTSSTWRSVSSARNWTCLCRGSGESTGRGRRQRWTPPETAWGTSRTPRAGAECPGQLGHRTGGRTPCCWGST